MWSDLELQQVVYYSREEIRDMGGWELVAWAEPTSIKDSHLSLRELSVYLMDSLMTDKMIE